MPAVAAALPDAVIGLVPDFRQMLKNIAFQRPGAFVKFQLSHARLMERIDQFAVNIELQLGVRGVTDPDRLRAIIAGQPARLPFQQPPVAHDAVHDLHVCRRTRHSAQ